jgi:palmitoyltransferase
MHYRLYISRGANPNVFGGILKSTPLHWAARQGHLAVTVLLIRAGADWHLMDVEGKWRGCS